MFKTSRRLRALGVSLAVASAGGVVIAGCGGSTASPSGHRASANVTDITFYSGVQNAEEVIPQLAVDDHLFPSNVKVTLKYGVQSLALPLLASGKAQFLLNPSPSVEVAPAGTIKWAAAYENIADSVFIGRPQVQGCAGMKGKKVGVIVPGSVLALQSYAALKTCGLTSSDYKTVPLGTMPSTLSGFVAGTVDGIAVDPVTAKAAETKLLGTKVIYDLWAHKYPWNNMGVATNASWAESHPEAEVAVLRGLNAALKVFHSDPAKAKQAIAHITGQQGAAVDYAYATLRHRFLPQLVPVAPKVEQQVLAVMRATGANVASTPSAYFLDPSYLQKALGGTSS